MAFLIGVALSENCRIANSIIGIRPQLDRIAETSFWNGLQRCLDA